jgi:lysyl oxidase
MMRYQRFVVAAVVLAAMLLSTGPVTAQLSQCPVIGPLLPDLIIDQQRLVSQIYVSEEQFNNNDCTVIEGCVTKAGKHTLLRFNTSTANVGLADLIIGNPAGCIALFHFSECHQHYHFENFADYRLWTLAGYQNWVNMRDLAGTADSPRNGPLIDAALASGDLVIGHKQGFCMVDSYHYDTTRGPADKVYRDCASNQGISVGWSDEYGPILPGQFVQITGLSDGDYVLENQVNPLHLLPESDFTNNFAAVKLRYTGKHGKVPATAEVIE